MSAPGFAVAPGAGEPGRSVSLAGASNFRDLGGYRVADGRAVRWRTLFRSDHLAALTAHDAQVLQTLGVTRAFDFRGSGERAAAAYELPGVAQHPLPIEPTVVQGLRALIEAGQAVTAERATVLMRQTYRNFVLHGSDRFAALFAQLLRSDQPLVFHCTAGKDRTGYAAALILHALGVPHEDVMRDYLLTNALYRLPAAPDSRAPREVLQVLWRVQPDFLDAAFDVIERDFGGIDRYLADRLGVGAAQRQQLARTYLREPA